MKAKRAGLDGCFDLRIGGEPDGAGKTQEPDQTDDVLEDFVEIDTFYVAGGFGNYLDIPKAISIGLLPDVDPEKVLFVGNSSLMGARMALLSTHTLERTIKIAKSMTNIELSTYQPFMDEYVAAMFLPHTDRRLFPSVSY